ncbi:amino acid ABC transporter permease [Bacillus sp. CLL-7-23]|uniref:Amino acid ABC transporter permease n=1 Tax=Bacillus changyiensis TaxID=3004103 RepID=A0ABT4X2B8_9BACI|nr:amino acid ABC transporter permease [Bacillus changyiensis]MDA7026450.1 amino acid ABC transporter permease [Bacillus changyiensis]
MFLNDIPWDLVRESFWPIFLRGIYYSIPLAIISFIFGMLLALITALSRMSKSRILKTVFGIYVSAIRGTPLFVQLFIIFYLFPAFQVTIDPFPSAIIAFSLNVGAYASEIIRASILSVPKGQWEAAYSIGMTSKMALFRVILPQAVRVSIPPLSNTFISLIKDTSLASQILVAELFRKAQEIGASNLDQILFIYIEAAFIYWIICFVLSIGQQLIERRLDRYVAK